MEIFENGKYIYRDIRPEEGEEAALIESICFPPHEACPKASMIERAQKVPELFLVAEDAGSGHIAGFLNGIATDEPRFRDDFFLDPALHLPAGQNIMLLGLDVLPAHRGRGLARELVRRYAARERARGRKQLILTCLDDKVRMYEKMGFEDLGISDSVWGGEIWHEMRLPVR